MRRNRILVPVHFVWATKNRLEWITPEWEARIYPCLRSESEKMGCEVLAVGGMPDHVHLAVLFGSRYSFAQFVKQMKGTTSRLVHEDLTEESPLRWQEGYGAFAFQYSLAPTMIKYIETQKHHHGKGSPWPELETTTIDV